MSCNWIINNSIIYLSAREIHLINTIMSKFLTFPVDAIKTVVTMVVDLISLIINLFKKSEK